MESIIQVFRMYEINPRTRIDIITKLGRAINDQYGMNITEDLVDELVKKLAKDCEVLENNEVPI